MKYLLQIFIFFIFIFLSLEVYAQMPGLGLTTENVFLEIFPSSPLPETNVTASVSTQSFNINIAYISWYLNGKKVKEGRGEKSYSFRAGKIGEETRIEAMVETPSQETITKLLSFIPADADLLWEAKTTTPAGYEAKALASVRSKIKISVVPHFIYQGRRLPSSQLIYKWLLNDEIRDEASGFGRQSFELTLPILAQNSQGVGVEIEEPNGKIKIKKFVSVPIVNPQVLIYEEHPLEGPRFNQALASFSAHSPLQIDFRAEPYYFSPDDLKYNWLVNGQEPQIKPPHNILSLKIGEGIFGTIPISIVIENLTNVLQAAQNNMEINVE